MKISEAIQYLEQQISDPHKGLPEDVFLFVSRLTPMANVDLLIKDENGRTLLSWRDDQFTSAGWHLPGGIIRYKEKMEDRVQKVAVTEIGRAVNYDPAPLSFHQGFCHHSSRGHFISFLYKCSLVGDFVPANKGLTRRDPGFLQWHKHCPHNLVKAHKMYRKYI